MSEFSNLGVSLLASNPRWLSNTWDIDLTPQVSAWSHVSQAIGGYWSATASLASDLGTAEWWLQNGLGAHIELFDDVLTKCWEGVVNRITINVGPLSVVRGPLLNVANYLDAYYSYVDDTVDPPSFGERTATGNAQNADSQAQWGIFQKILSMAGAKTADAQQVRDTYLAEHKLPLVSQQWSSQAQQQSISLECVGYVQYFNWPYNDTNSADINASTKIGYIVADNPNIAWLAFDTTHIETNNAQVMRYDNDNKIAWALIKEITARGDTSDNRWLFGVYNDFQVYYNQAPTDTEYQQRLTDEAREITLMDGGFVAPWNVRPGKWLEFPDFLVGYTTPTDRRQDPRLMFIEQVRYTAPFGLQLMGGKFDTLPQTLGKLGLAGVGA